MAEEDKINIKDIHQTFWRCRDFEISNLWQRSIFLTAFLVLCFTAYGSVLSKLFGDGDHTNYILCLNVAAYVLAILGVIFSILWIKMGKGSKAWYEVYESAIRALETNKKYSTKKASKIGGFSYTELTGYTGVKINNNLFSNKAGAYSVSKINIAIGQVFLVLWSIISLIHTAFLGMYLHDNSEYGYADLLVTTIGLIFLFTVILVFSNSNIFRSTSGIIEKTNNNN